MIESSEVLLECMPYVARLLTLANFIVMVNKKFRTKEENTWSKEDLLKKEIKMM